MPAYSTVGSAIERNRIASESAYLILMEINVKDGSGNHVEYIRLCKNTENIEFPTGSGEIYDAANFDIDIKENANELPTIKVEAQDILGIVRERMEQYGGGVGFEVRIMIVNSDALDGTPELDETFQVLGSNASANFGISFDLGADSPLVMRFPRHLQFRDRCMWTYKGSRCKYAGPLGSCDFTLDGDNGCRVHDNVSNFGGFPALRRLNI